MLYIKFLLMHSKQQMQHKLSFFLSLVGQVGLSFTTFLGVYFMFERFHEIEGFSFQQVLICFSVVLMAFSLAECFGRGFDSFPRMLGNGEFDRVLVRPRNEMLLVLLSQLDLSRLGRVVQSAIMLAWAMPRCGVVWTADKIFTLILMLACGCFCFFALFILYAGISFFTIQGLEFMNIFTDGAREFGRYPFSIYGKKVLMFLTWVIPLAMFQYYPLLYLIGEESSPLYMLAPLACLPFALPCLLLWKTGLRRYKSTGS